LLVKYQRTGTFFSSTHFNTIRYCPAGTIQVPASDQFAIKIKRIGIRRLEILKVIIKRSFKKTGGISYFLFLIAP